MITVGSLFAGVGGIDLGLERAGGFKVVWQVEIDKQANAVRSRHWPDVARYEDVREFTLDTDPVRPDIICGGPPCQDLSVAGKRAGLAGARSGLFHQFMRIVAERNPRWVLIENVPGLLSSANGRDMGVVLSTLAELGYGTAYRVLDAQWFGVSQRRKRVFIVGHFGNWRRAAEVLFEPESLPWNPPPSREAGSRVARAIANGSGSSGYRLDPNGEEFIAVGGDVCHSLTPEGHDASEDGTGRGTPVIAIQERASSESETSGPGGKGWQEDVAFTCEARTTPQAVAYRTSGNSGVMEQGDKTAALNCGTDQNQTILQDSAMQVRRLTPREEERCFGFPDDWTRYGADGTEISDSARYRMLGNAVVVPVAEWIGRRILAADERNSDE